MLRRDPDPAGPGRGMGQRINNKKLLRKSCLQIRKLWFWLRDLPHSTLERAWKYIQYSTRPFQGTPGTNLRARTAAHPPPGDFGLVQGKAAQASLLASCFNAAIAQNRQSAGNGFLFGGSQGRVSFLLYPKLQADCKGAAQIGLSRQRKNPLRRMAEGATAFAKSSS